MRNIVSCICSLLIFAICGFGQVNKSNPLGGEIKETFSSSESRVFVGVELLKEDDPALSVPITSISDVKMIVLSVTVKLPNGEVKITTVNRPATSIDENPQLITKNFQVEISSALNINPNPPFKLPKNWESFTYKITCNVAGEAQPKSTAILHMQKPTGAITVQNFTIKVDRPIWIRDVNGKRSDELIVPITSTSASLVAEIVLKQGASDEIRTPKPVFLPKGESTPVRFDARSFGESPIEIRVKPTELEAVQLNLTGQGCSNTPNDPVCSLEPDFRLPFQINQTESELRDLKITSLEQPKTIRVRTTSSAKPNSMKAKLNGKAINVTGSGNFFQITLDTETFRDLKEGDSNTLEFEGESLEGGIKLSEKPFKIEKNTKPKLVGYPTFTLEENKLKLVYELSGDVIDTKPELKYKEGGGTAGTFGDSNCNKVNGNLKCSPELTVSFDSIRAQDKQRPQIQVKLEILAQERGSEGLKTLESGSFGFDLINQGAIKKHLDDIRETWRSDNTDGKDDRARKSIAEKVFLNKLQSNDEQVKQAFEKYVKEPNNSEKRRKWFQFFAGVGNFALKGFGIPIQIPTELSN